MLIDIISSYITREVGWTCCSSKVCCNLTNSKILRRKKEEKHPNFELDVINTSTCEINTI